MSWVLEVYMPFLPKRSLSPNRRDRHLWNGEAVHELREATSTALLFQSAVVQLNSPFKRIAVDVALALTNRKPNIETCPRCWQWLLDHPRSNQLRCLCYRPTDAGNAISALKPFFDGIQDAGIIVNDRFEHLEIGRIRKRTVTNLADEGLHVVLRELED